MSEAQVKMLHEAIPLINKYLKKSIADIYIYDNDEIGVAYNDLQGLRLPWDSRLKIPLRHYLKWVFDVIDKHKQRGRVPFEIARYKRLYYSSLKQLLMEAEN